LSHSVRRVKDFLESGESKSKRKKLLDPKLDLIELPELRPDDIFLDDDPDEGHDPDHRDEDILE
jgi:hypothetical protein